MKDMDRLMFYVNNTNLSLFELALKAIFTKYKPYKRFRFCLNYANLKNDLNTFGLPECLKCLVLKLFCTEINATVDCFLQSDSFTNSKLICFKCYNARYNKEIVYKVKEIYNFFYYNKWETELHLKCFSCNSNLLHISGLRVYKRWTDFNIDTDTKILCNNATDVYVFAEYWQNRKITNKKLCIQCFKTVKLNKKHYRNSVIGFSFSSCDLKDLKRIYKCCYCLRVVVNACEIKYFCKNKKTFNNNDLVSLLIS